MAGEFPNLLDELLGTPIIAVDGVDQEKRTRIDFLNGGGAAVEKDRIVIDLAAVGTRTGILIDALRLIEGSTEGERRELKGYTTAGDGAQGTFQWRTGTAVDNGGTILNRNGYGNGATGYWERVYSGSLDPRWFGAVGGGADDSTPYMRAIQAAGRRGVKVRVPRGTWRVKLDLDGTISLGTRYEHILISGEGKTEPGLYSGSILQAITKAQNGGTEPEFVVRCAGRNMVLEDLAIDGDYRAESPLFFDYQSFGSGAQRVTVTRALAYAPITVAPNSGTDSFHAVGHGLVDGDLVQFRTTATLPDTLYQAVPGTFGWVFSVVNASADDFQIERYAGEGVWTFTTNGTGTITATKYGGNLVRIGGASGLQADTGFLRDVILQQEQAGPTTSLTGRGIFISDNNAVLWKFDNVHIDGVTDGVYIRGGGGTFSKVTLQATPTVTRACIVKDGHTGAVAFTDECFTEQDAAAWIVCLNPEASDYHQPWILHGQHINTEKASINWDCKQPLTIIGNHSGDVNITALGGQYIQALGLSFGFSNEAGYGAFKGDVERVIQLGTIDQTGRVRSEMGRFAGPSAPVFNLGLATTAPGQNGYGLFVSGGEPNDGSIRKAGPVVIDLGEPNAGGTNGNSSSPFIFGRRAAAVAIESVNVGASKFKITGHGLGVNDTVRLSTDDTLPVGLHAETDYWVIPLDADYFQLGKDRNSQAPITLTDAGTGTHSVHPLKYFASVSFDASNISGYPDATRIDSIGPVVCEAPVRIEDSTDEALNIKGRFTYDDERILNRTIAVAATDGGAHTETIYVPAVNKPFGVTATVELRDGSDVSRYTVLVAAFKRVAGVVTQIGATTPSVNLVETGSEAWLVGLDTDGTNVRFTYTLANGVNATVQMQITTGA